MIEVKSNSSLKTPFAFCLFRRALAALRAFFPFCIIMAQTAEKGKFGKSKICAAFLCDFTFRRPSGEIFCHISAKFTLLHANIDIPAPWKYNTRKSVLLYYLV